MSDRPDTEFDKLASVVQDQLDAAIRPPTTFVIVMRCGPEMTVMGNGNKDEGAKLLGIALRHVNAAATAAKGPAS